jgi:molecular chaperone DnaK (HSP70)
VFKKYTGIFAISYNGVLGWDLYEFLEKYITKKYKLIILDNASSHRNEKIKELLNKHNTLLYSVPYQHFTNSIENYFSMMKSRLQKLNGLTHKELKTNIEKVIKDIPKDKYENIIKGTYNITKKYSKKPSNRIKTLKNFKCAKV